MLNPVTALALRFCSLIIPALIPVSAAMADTCSGKYSQSAQMVDAALGRYGTLYSGGEHKHAIDHVGATVDLYRLWHGLPDWQLRGLSVREVFGEHFTDVPGSIPDTQLATAKDSSRYSDQQKLATLVKLDFAGASVTPPDAWLGKSAYRADRPLLYWLQFTLTASSAPWSFAPQLGIGNTDTASYTRLRNEATRRSKNGQDLAWAVAAQLLAAPGQQNAAQHRQFETWRNKVRTCKATPAEYAAWAVSAANYPWSRYELRNNGNSQWQTIDEKLLAQLPDSTRRLVLKNTAWAVFTPYLTNDRFNNADREAAAAQLDKLSRLAPDRALRSWINVGRSYLAEDIKQLTEIHRNTPVDQKSVRVFNLLSAAHLAYLAKNGEWSPGMRQALTATAFARNVALGNERAATQLIPDIQAAFPDQAADITQIMQQKIPLHIRLARIVLNNPKLSAWLTYEDEPDNYTDRFVDDDISIRQRHLKTRYDLPLELSNREAIQDDFETWLRLPQRVDRFYGMRGTSIHELDRINASRSRHLPPSRPVFPLLASWHARPGIGQLTAWQEMTYYTGGQGLSNKVSLSIIEWANTANASWTGRHLGKQNDIADALRKVILLNQRNHGGTLHGQPVGQVAFTLLRQYYPDSNSAKQTRYWYQYRAEN